MEVDALGCGVTRAATKTASSTRRTGAGTTRLRSRKILDGLPRLSQELSWLVALTATTTTQ
jgi:hypothetical protein